MSAVESGEPDRVSRVAAPGGFAARMPPLVASGLPDSGELGLRMRELASLGHDFEEHMRTALAVNSTDLAAMELLIRRGPQTPSELARGLDVTTAAATLVVDRLVSAGHASRAPHAEDRRKVVVTPAPASTQMAFDTLRPVVAGVAGVVAALSDADRATVTRYLDAVLDVYRSALGSAAS